MFDFLTLSVVIDDKIFCVHGGQFACPVFPFYQPIYACVISFKVSPRPFTPLTKSRSSTDSEVCLDYCACPCDPLTCFPCQKYHMKAPWQT